jgi:hypothetical protein
MVRHNGAAIQELTSIINDAAIQELANIIKKGIIDAVRTKIEEMHSDGTEEDALTPEEISILERAYQEESGNYDLETVNDQPLSFNWAEEGF